MNENKRHRLTVDRRESVAITGVLDVISFDEDSVVCETDMGVLTLRGGGLNVASLNLDAGTLALSGEVASINYEAQGAHLKGSKKGMLGKIFK